jgi:hypothetical protein
MRTTIVTYMQHQIYFSNIQIKQMQHPNKTYETYTWSTWNNELSAIYGHTLSYLRSRITRPTNAYVDVALRSSHEIQASDLLSSHMLTTHARPHMPHAPQSSEWPHALSCADSRKKKQASTRLTTAVRPAFFLGHRALQCGLVHPYIRTPATKHYRLE